MGVLLFDSRNPLCKAPFGALATEEICTLRVWLPISYQMRRPVLTVYRADQWDAPVYRLTMDFVDSDGIGNIYKTEFSTTTPDLFFYCFEVQGVNGLLYISRDQDGFGVLGEHKKGLWQLTVYHKDMKPAKFLERGIFYQIFPDRFCRSGEKHDHVPAERVLHETWGELPVYQVDAQGKYHNNDFFGGDLKGIMEKLPYLRDLGVGCIYLNPIFESESNHRYNTADYRKVDPLLGTNEDFAALCQKAKEYGISIILDGVFNHAGSDSVYFNREGRYGEHSGAYRDPNSPYRDWFMFSQYPEKYSSWWGFDTLPDFNEENQGYRDMVYGKDGIVRYWMKQGAAGWRLDVADELTDPTLDGIHRAAFEEKEDAFIVGEVWEDASTKFAYGQRRHYLLGEQLCSVMNYPFKDAILSYVRDGNAFGLYTTVVEILEHYPQPVICRLMNSLSTHDVERAMTALAGESSQGHDRNWQGAHHQLSPHQLETGKKLLKLAAVLQYTLPGIPCLYYGDEAGLFGYRDPFNRTCYPWGQEDKELISYFQKLGQLRQRFPGLCQPGFRAIRFEKDVVSYLREWDDTELFVAVNRSDNAVLLRFPEVFAEKKIVFGHIYDGYLQGHDAVVLER